MLAGGVIGAVVLPTLSDKQHKRQPFLLLGFSLAIPGLIGLTFGSGWLLWLLTKSHRRELLSRDGFLLVNLVWVVLTAYAAVPLVFTVPGVTVSQAYFEAMSAALTVELDDEMDFADYEANFRRMFGNERMDAVIGSLEGSVRFYGLTETSMNLEGLDRHQRLIDSYRKVHAARAKMAA